MLMERLQIKFKMFFTVCGHESYLTFRKKFQVAIFIQISIFIPFLNGFFLSIQPKIIVGPFAISNQHLKHFSLPKSDLWPLLLKNTVHPRIMERASFCIALIMTILFYYSVSMLPSSSILLTIFGKLLLRLVELSSMFLFLPEISFALGTSEPTGEP